NNAVTLTVMKEGQAFTNAVLYHFDAPSPTVLASQLAASVDWGDSQSNSSGDGTGTVAVVANPNGGFDVLGSHTYDDHGSYALGLTLTNILPGIPSLAPGLPVKVAVADVPLAAALNTQVGDVRPETLALMTPPVVQGQTYQNAILAGFPNPLGLPASAFTATVQWGDGTSNQSGDGMVSIFPDPKGGYTIIGTHSYAGAVGAIYSVRVSTTQGPVANSPVLFHFTDANPNATATDFTATVAWGDGTSNSSADGTGRVSVVADPSGGFDVLGSPTYTQAVRKATFSVQVTDVAGASVSASNPNSGVDAPLAAGPLTVPSVASEGQSVQDVLLFHFTDTASEGQASDFSASVLWGDGSNTDSTDGTG